MCLPMLPWRRFFLVLLLMPVLSCTSITKPDQGVVKEAEGKFNEKSITISELTLGPGDEIAISVWRNPDLNGKYRIDASGKIFIPLAGIIEVKGISAFKLREKVVDALSQYLVNPQVRVVVSAYRSNKITVIGEVQKPGIFQMDETTTLLEAIVKSGGFTLDANPGNVLLIRNGLEQADVKDFDMDDLLNEGDLSQNPFLKRGDIVYVPSSFIADVDRFSKRLTNILTSIIRLEQGIILEPQVEDVFNDETNRPIVIETDF